MNWSEEDIDFLINNYGKINNTDLSKILNRDTNSIWYKAKMLNLTKELDKWAKEDIDFLINNYEKNGIAYICKYLNKSKDSVQYYAKKFDLKIDEESRRTRILNKLNYRDPDSFNVNPYNFFNIDKKEISYILGLLWADGFGYSNKISVTLIENDGKELIGIFENTGKWKIKYKTPLNRKPQITFSTYNRLIYEFLKENDFKNKKTISPQKILFRIPDNLKHYFFRGYFDGDGTIFMKKGQYVLNLTSSYNQDWKIYENLMKKLEIIYHISRVERVNNLNRINRYSRIIITNRDGIIKFCEYIYENFENEKMGLKRKYNIFLNIKKTIKK